MHKQALALLRHTPYPSGATRARLLLVVGQLRARTMVLTADQAAYEPPKTAPAEEEKKDDKKGKGKGGKGKGKGKEVAEEEPEGPPTIAGGLLLDHPLAVVVSTLHNAMAVSFASGGHDHMLMREACLSLVIFLGKPAMPHLRDVHQHMATKYLLMAADLSERYRKLQTQLPTMVTSGVIPGDALPPAIIEQLTDSDTEAGNAPTELTMARAVRLLLSLLSEKVDSTHLLFPHHWLSPSVLSPMHSHAVFDSLLSLPLCVSSLLDVQSTDPLAMDDATNGVAQALHEALILHCPQYRDECLIEGDKAKEALTAGTRPSLPVFNESEPTVHEDMVVVQWRPCDPALSEEGGSGLRSEVDAYMVLGSVSPSLSPLHSTLWSFALACQPFLLTCFPLFLCFLVQAGHHVGPR